MVFGLNLSMLMNIIILLGRQYYILYKPNHRFLNFLMRYFLPFGNQKTMSPIEKVAGILLASKGKGHKSIEMTCVWWLP
jgi:hypothetical protein